MKSFSEEVRVKFKIYYLLELLNNVCYKNSCSLNFFLNLEIFKVSCKFAQRNLKIIDKTLLSLSPLYTLASLKCL